MTDDLERAVQQCAALLTAARRLLRERRLRERMFDGAEFGEPAWDILLNLYIAHHEGKLISVSSLCVAAVVPATTALRWISTMEAQGHLRRHRDPVHKRRMFMSLSAEALSAMDRYLAALTTA
ncbi:MarR family transcriptional regulator [Nostoc sp. 3335mG]|nr:MarR family transcriptional regulator [Nostoc sp. 3335mG]